MIKLENLKMKKKRKSVQIVWYKENNFQLILLKKMQVDLNNQIGQIILFKLIAIK